MKLPVVPVSAFAKCKDKGVDKVLELFLDLFKVLQDFTLATPPTPTPHLAGTLPPPPGPRRLSSRRLDIQAGRGAATVIEPPIG